MQVDPKSAPFSYDLPREFAAAMVGMAVGESARLAVAVSGGADSMALVLLLAGWARSRGANIYALTVDHGLREAAANEAAQVSAWLTPRRIAHTVLRWQEGPSYRHLQASAQSAAREARYDLMTRWCRANAYTHLFLAHHADDQAETFLLRLARGSGVDGLGAMASITSRDGVCLARPLLAIPKARLIAYCEEIGQPWIEDPSNGDPVYGRVRMRGARQALEREGLTGDRLLTTATHMRRARAALDHYVEALLDQACAWDRFGVARLSLERLLGAPEEVGLRALASLLMSVSGQIYRPRFERLSRLYESLSAGPWRDATLHGCFMTRSGGSLMIAREAAQIADERILHPGDTALWDGRFEISAESPGEALRLRRLLQRDVSADLRRTAAWSELPVFARETLPALFDSRGLAAVPPLGYLRPDLTEEPSLRFTAVFVGRRGAHARDDDAEL